MYTPYTYLNEYVGRDTRGNFFWFLLLDLLHLHVIVDLLQILHGLQGELNRGVESLPALPRRGRRWLRPAQP